jgi:adenine-specific DNA-methyltransferase
MATGKTSTLTYRIGSALREAPCTTKCDHRPITKIVDVMIRDCHNRNGVAIPEQKSPFSEERRPSLDELATDIDETNWPGVTLLKVQMNADLLTEDLKKKRAGNESFWLIGQPDVEVRKDNDGRYIVEVRGFDYYNTKTGGIESGGADKIAVWMLDTDYDGRSLYPRQVFFPMADDSDGWARLAKNLKTEIDEERIEAYRGTVSLPFEAGAHKRIAVKIVDDRGIESLKIIALNEPD